MLSEQDQLAIHRPVALYGYVTDDQLPADVSRVGRDQVGDGPCNVSGSLILPSGGRAAPTSPPSSTTSALRRVAPGATALTLTPYGAS